MISSIRLMNWRSHANSFLQFKKGTNILIGAMGSGKSSVLDAISFALFGTFPALERRRLKLVDVIKANEKSAEVSLEFVWQNTNYKTVRRINRKKDATNTEAQIFKDGKLIDEGSEVVTNYIENLLGVNYDLFTRAIYSEQNNIDYFLSLDPRKRKEEIDRLLGLDRFETVRANTTSLLNRVKDERKILEQKFNKAYLDELVRKKEELEKRLDEVKTTLENLAKAIDAGKKEIEAREKIFTELAKKKESYDKLTQEKIKLQTIIERLEKEIGGREFSLDKLEELKKEHWHISSEKNDKQAKLNEINALLTLLSSKRGSVETKKKIALTTKEQIKKTEEKINELLKGKRTEQLKDELEKEESALLTVLSEIGMLERSIKETEKIAKTLNVEMTCCPFCGAGLTPAKVGELVKEKEAKIINAKERLSKLKSEFSLKEKMISATKMIIREADSLNAQMQSLRSNYLEPKSLDDELVVIVKELETASRKRAEIQNTLNELNKKSEHNSLALHEYEQLKIKKAELKKSGALAEELSRSIKEVSFDAQLLENARTEFESARMKYERKAIDKKAKEEQLHSLLEMRAIIDRNLLNQKEMERSISDLLKAEDELGIYKNLVLETQLSLRNSMIDGINAAMNEIWQIFYPHKNYKEIRLVITDKDYELQVFDGQWKTLESIASGGERACAALTLRVALAMVLTPNLSWLILDEPTHNLDKDAIELLSNTLQYKVPEVVQQTFVITHDEALAGSEFASSYRMSRDKSVNGSTIVEVV